MKIPLILEPSPNFGLPFNYKWKSWSLSNLVFDKHPPPPLPPPSKKKKQKTKNKKKKKKEKSSCWNCKTKNSYDIKIYFYSVKVNFYSMKYIFFIPLFSWYQNMFLFNQNEFAFNKVYHYMHFSWCQKYFLFNQNKSAFNKKYLYHILFSHSSKMYFYYKNFPFSTFLGSISGLPFVSMKVRILLSVCWLR